MSTIQIHPLETNNGVVTSWLPLTTVWPLLQGCSTLYMLDEERMDENAVPKTATSRTATSRSAVSLVAFVPDYPESLYSGNTRCLPDEVTASWNHAKSWAYGITLAQNVGPRITNDKDSVYTQLTTSLATAVSLLPVTCPDGWSTVATFVKLSVSTQAKCCPPYVTSLHNASNKLIGGEENMFCRTRFFFLQALKAIACQWPVPIPFWFTHPQVQSLLVLQLQVSRIFSLVLLWNQNFLFEQYLLWVGTSNLLHFQAIIQYRAKPTRKS